MSFSSDLAKKLADAKAKVQRDNLALVPTTPLLPSLRPANAGAKSIAFTPPGELSLPPLLDQKLTEAILGGDPTVLFAWFRRLGHESRTKTNEAFGKEISSRVNLIQSYASVYRVAMENQRLPELIARSHQIQDLEYRNALINLDAAHKAAIAANMLTQRANEAGLDLASYMKTVDKEIELKYKHLEKEMELEIEQKRNDEQLRKLGREHEIEREHAAESAKKHIEVLSYGANHYLRRLDEIRDKIDQLHTEIDSITNDETLTVYLRQSKIKNRKRDLKDLEEERARLKKQFREVDTGEDA